MTEAARICPECTEPLPPDSTAVLCPKCALWREIQDKPSSPAAAADPLEDEWLGHFRLIKKLGEGGMGAVYQARDETLDRIVAVKVLSRRLVGDEEFARRFVREARAVAALNHPNIIHIYFVGEQEGVIFFAMEFVDGQDLASMQRERGQVAEANALDWIRQAALGLRHAQRQGMIHRDIKPANLMLSRDGIIKIADFGLAKNLSPDAQTMQLTNTQAIVGTPHYISPEQAQTAAVDHRSDIYSLGATLYHLLAGRPPFIAESAMMLILQHLNQPPPPIHQFNAAVSPATAALLDKMLAKDPAQRPQDYDELSRELDAARRGELAAAAPGTVFAPPARRRSRGRAATLIALCALILAAAVVWISDRRDLQQRARKALPAAPAPQASVPPSPLPTPTTPLPAPGSPRRVEKLGAMDRPMREKLAHMHSLPLDISSAYNANIISTASAPAKDWFEPTHPSSWATADLLQKHGKPGAGIPDNGRVSVKHPRGLSQNFFVNTADGNDAILLTDRSGRQPKPVTVLLPLKQQRHYSRLGLLHGACGGNGVLTVTLHYARGPETTATLNVLDWNPQTRPLTGIPDLAPAVVTAAYSHSRREPFHIAHMFAQWIDADPLRPLRSLTFEVSSHTDPRGLEAGKGAQSFTAAIFAVSAMGSPFLERR